MARKVSFSALESRSARLRLKIRRRPYSGPSLARGISLMYRRNGTNGTWVIKASDGHGAYWTKGFAFADNFEDADAKDVLTFYQAQDAAKKLARGEDGSRHLVAGSRLQLRACRCRSGCNRGALPVLTVADLAGRLRETTALPADGRSLATLSVISVITVGSRQDSLTAFDGIATVEPIGVRPLRGLLLEDVYWRAMHAVSLGHGNPFCVARVRAGAEVRTFPSA